MKAALLVHCGRCCKIWGKSDFNKNKLKRRLVSVATKQCKWTTEDVSCLDVKIGQWITCCNFVASMKQDGLVHRDFTDVIYLLWKNLYQCCRSYVYYLISSLQLLVSQGWLCHAGRLFWPVLGYWHNIEIVNTGFAFSWCSIDMITESRCLVVDLLSSLRCIYYSIDSSHFVLGTDDDLPPAQNRGIRGRSFSGNGRASAGAFPYMRATTDLESEIHRVEQDAYTGVLRAFKVQSDAISWVLL